MCKFINMIKCFFSPTHYRCKLCGVYSGSPDALCFPEEKTFEE